MSGEAIDKYKFQPIQVCMKKVTWDHMLDENSVKSIQALNNDIPSNKHNIIQLLMQSLHLIKT